MPLINLIAEQRQWKRNRFVKARTWFIIFATVSAVGILSFGTLLIGAEYTKAEMESMRASIIELRPLTNAVDENEKQLLDLQPRLQTLGAARDDTERWTRIFDHVSLVMPTDTWLTNVRAQQPSDPRQPVQVAWIGMSTEQNLIGELMLRLQRAEDLANVQLEYTELKRTSFGTGLEFKIDCVVAGTGEKIGLTDTDEEGT